LVNFMLISVLCFSQSEFDVYCSALKYIKDSKQIKSKVVDCFFLSKFKYSFLDMPIKYCVAPIFVPISFNSIEYDTAFIKRNPWIITCKNDSSFIFDKCNIPEEYTICDDANGKLTIYFSKYISHVLLCEIFMIKYTDEESWKTTRICGMNVKICFIFNEHNQIIDFRILCIDYG